MKEERKKFLNDQKRVAPKRRALKPTDALYFHDCFSTFLEVWVKLQFIVFKSMKTIYQDNITMVLNNMIFFILNLLLPRHDLFCNFSSVLRLPDQPLYRK